MNILQFFILSTAVVLCSASYGGYGHGGGGGGVRSNRIKHGLR